MNVGVVSSLGTTIGVLLVLLAGASLGVYLRVPSGHVDTDSRDVVRSVMGLLSTMAAVLLSLLIASSKTAYDTQATEVQEIAAKLLLLDRTLAHYGPETAEARTSLRTLTQAGVDHLWPEHGQGTGRLPEANQAGIEHFLRQLRALTPGNGMQRIAQEQAIQTSSTLVQIRLLMAEQAKGSVPMIFLLILISWVACLFVGYGLFARMNATVICALAVGALAVSGAIFLIVELNNPYSGYLRISDTAMRNTLALMGRP